MRQQGDADLGRATGCCPGSVGQQTQVRAQPQLSQHHQVEPRPAVRILRGVGQAATTSMELPVQHGRGSQLSKQVLPNTGGPCPPQEDLAGTQASPAARAVQQARLRHASLAALCSPSPAAHTEKCKLQRSTPPHGKLRPAGPLSKYMAACNPDLVVGRQLGADLAMLTVQRICPCQQ